MIKRAEEMRGEQEEEISKESVENECTEEGKEMGRGDNQEE